MSKSIIETSGPSVDSIVWHPHDWLPPRGDVPIRGELFGVERLEELAARLAESCGLAPRRRLGSPLLGRFAENERFLQRVHRRIAGQTSGHPSSGFDAEWFADNFHIIDEVLREVRRDLPPGYDRELPKLVDPPLGGYPRVYALALVAHTDSELDEARLTRFVRVFQKTATLTIGELWALPTMFRLVLLENLRRLAGQMIWRWEERQHADRWAAEAWRGGRVSGARPPAPPADASDSFVVRLLQLLDSQEPRAPEVLASVERWLESLGVGPNDVLLRDHRRQAANQVSVGNCVISPGWRWR